MAKLTSYKLPRQKTVDLDYRATYNTHTEFFMLFEKGESSMKITLTFEEAKALYDSLKYRVENLLEV